MAVDPFATGLLTSCGIVVSKITVICLPRHTHGSSPCTFDQLRAKHRAPMDRSSAAHQWADTDSIPTARCSSGGLGSHATSYGHGTACNSRFSFAKVALTQGYICPAQPGAIILYCSACLRWRTTRRPEDLLRHVLCAQLHCRDWVFTSTCQFHAQLLRPDSCLA